MKMANGAKGLFFKGQRRQRIGTKGLILRQRIGAKGLVLGKESMQRVWFSRESFSLGFSKIAKPTSNQMFLIQWLLNTG